MRGSSGPSVEGPLVPATAPSRGSRECVTVSIIEEPAPAAMEVDTQPMDCCSPPTNLTSPQQQLQQFQQQMHGTPAQSLFVRGPFGRSRSNSAASSVTSVASNISDYSNLDDFEVPDQATPIRAVPRPKSLAVLQSLVARCQAKPHEDFLLNVQKNEVRPHKRADLLRWLFALNNHFQFGPNVFALTAEYVDRFLSVSKIKDKYLHIIGVASFLIASKMEEETDVQPTEAELVANGGDVFTINDLVRMETIVLSKLNWELRPVTPLAILDELISVCTEKLVAARGEDILQALPALRLGASIKLHMSLFHYQLRLLPAPWLALCVLAVELCELLSSTTVEGVLDEFSDLVGLDHATFLETVDLININLRFQAGLTLPQGTREDGGASPPSEQQMQMQVQMQQQQSQSQAQSQQRQSPPQQLQSRVLVTVSPA